MKFKSLIAAALFVTTSAFAHNPENPQTRKMQLPMFDQLVIDAKVDVVLIDDAEPGTIYLVGDPKLFDDLAFKIEKNELLVSSKKDVNYKSKVTIEIHVKKLAKVSLQNEALVFSGNMLRSPKINVHIKEGSKASLVSSGEINVISEDDTELVFLRKTPGVTVANR